MSDVRKECCGNCRFYVADEEQCRRNPPAVNLSYTLLRGLRALYSGNRDPEGETCGSVCGEWPKVLADEWCGEFRPIEGASQ